MENPPRDEGENSGADHVLLKDVGMPFFAEGFGFGLSLDLGFYEISAVFRAAYRFTDRLYILISPADPPAHRILLLARAITAGASLEKIAGELLNELIEGGGAAQEDLFYSKRLAWAMREKVN